MVQGEGSPPPCQNENQSNALGRPPPPPAQAGFELPQKRDTQKQAAHFCGSWFTRPPLCSISSVC